MARFAVLLCVLSLAAPGAALAQGPFTPLPPAPPEPTATAPAQEEDDDGLSSTQQLLIAMSGIVLLLGIAWAIVRDARGAAPAETRAGPGAGPGGDDGPRPRGSRTPAGVRHRTNRAKAKAARQARKKSRKR